jgi:hypothetical protein
LNQIGLASASTSTSPHQTTEQTGGWLQGFCLPMALGGIREFLFGGKKTKVMNVERS